MRVLAGDVGGTHARLAVVEIDQRHITVELTRTYPSHAFPGLAPIVLDFLGHVKGGIDHACFGVACPVVEGDCETPNLPWKVSARHLAAEIGIPRTRVINDLDAIAFGIARLEPADLVTLQPGTPAEHGVIGIIGAGTGLGQAFLVWEGDRYRPRASEGGHASFAARTDLEWELHRFLAAEFGHVSFERVLSGPGLESVYRFLAARGGTRERAEVRAAVGTEGAAAVSRFALEKSDPLCIEALEIFVSAYGAQAGNLALTVLATGGVYIVGGIAPAVVDKLKDGGFMSAFRDKGRLSALLARIPVYVVMNPSVGLFGAAVAATEDATLPSGPAAAPSSPNMMLGARR